MKNNGKKKKIGNNGMMNDQQDHWPKAKPEKFKHFSHPDNFIRSLPITHVLYLKKKVMLIIFLHL